MPPGLWAALINALASGRDAYGCVPEIIAREKALGVRSSFQVAVANAHPNDVNYSIDDDAVRDYLRVITDEGFDLCLHGSYRSAEQVDRYVAEAELLATRLARPVGSRQHFLSFDYDTLFTAQEAAGIRYDMSIGFPDRPGPRAGFSYPYFPYCLAEDRPYDVVEIGLFLMDATLSGYLNLSAEDAESVITSVLDGSSRERRLCICGMAPHRVRRRTRSRLRSVVLEYGGAHFRVRRNRDGRSNDQRLLARPGT